MLTLFFLFAGELPKQLPTSLEVLIFADEERMFGHPKFTGGIPSEWGALTNLKELKMVGCGLDGKPLSIRSDASKLLIFVDFCAAMPGRVPAELAKLTNLTRLHLRRNSLEFPLSAPTDFFGEMEYHDREAVAAFQASLTSMFYGSRDAVRAFQK